MNEKFVIVLAGAALLVAAVALWRAAVRIGRTRRTWRELGLRNDLKCVHCGYDLRAANDLCQECGEPVPAERAEARLADSGGWPPAGA